MDNINEILSSAVELNTAPEKTEEKQPEAVEKVEEQPKEQAPTLEELETLSEKTDEHVPLKKYMAEKNAKREAEDKAKVLESELQKLRENPYKSNEDIKVDVKSLSEKHQIDEEVLADILKASYTLTKDKVKAELEQELAPTLKEIEHTKREKERQEFDSKFNSLLDQSLKEMPEYSELVDKDDLKDWVKSGQYSKLTLPELIEKKYGKFVTGKKTLETSHASKSIDTNIDKSKPLTDEQYLQLDSNPELKKEWAESLQERVRKYL